MDWMTFLLDMLKLTIPAMAVFLVSFYSLKQFLENDYQKRLLELRKASAGDLTPTKMMAYERMILFLERINPSSLLVRHTVPGMSASQLKLELINAINEEYNHNIAQQLYLSPQAWKLIKVVKEQVITIIVESYKTLDSDAKGVDLSRAVLDTIIRSEDMLTDKAVEFLKKEFKLIFD